MEDHILSFKFKLTKKDLPGLGGTPFNIKTGKLGGIYQQAQGNRVGYSNQNFSLQDLQKAIGDVFIKDPTRTRQITIHTNQAGMELFQEALMKEQNKKAKKDEYRKKFNFRSKILKQTYKFR